MTELDRRTLLLGATGLAGLGVLLAACSDDADDADAPGTTDPTSPTGGEALAVPMLVPSFPDGFRGPSPLVHSVEQRVAYALHDGIDIMRDNAPESVSIEILLEDEPIGGGEVVRRDAGVPTPYFAVTFTPPRAGTYTSVLSQDGETSVHEFLVLEPTETTVPQPGDPLPAIDTPTTDDARGVDPICTRVEPCPFHATNLADALAAGDRPTVLSIATPGFCQTAICGPVIDLLIDEVGTREDLHVIHAEVYVDPHNDDGVQTGQAQTTEIVDGYGLPFEPVLYVADAAGIIVRRLDAMYDGSELAEALALV